MSTLDCGTPIRIAASGQVYKTSGGVLGVLCNSSSAGTLTLYDSDGGAVGTPFAAAIPVVAGAYLPLHAGIANGLYCTLGGTADVTFFIG